MSTNTEADITRMRVISNRIADELACSTLATNEDIAGLLIAARERIDEAVRISTGATK